MGLEVYTVFGLGVLFFTFSLLLSRDEPLKKLSLLYSISFLLLSAGYLVKDKLAMVDKLLIVSGYLFFIFIFYLNYSFASYHRKFADKRYIDPMTGLFNRSLLEEVIKKEAEMCQKLGIRYVVFFLDLDNFKRINDTMGHETGDRILSEFGKALKSILRKDKDKIVRYGGDEFLIFAEVSSCGEALSIAHRIENRLQGLNGVYLSMGFACYPEDGHDLAQLIRVADGRMYQMKRLGKDISGQRL
ncbi:MAG: GGDEF domain-containing protein [Aquificaceae bacterium]|nr:GGDEF domain-containing protein [Aquificaceae bacterium]